MPNPETTERAKEDLREGKSPSTAAGEFVHEEIDHVREGKHGARSPQQAIAIGLSEARRAGIPLKPPKKGSASVKKAESDYARGQSGAAKKVSPRRSAARKRVMKSEPKSTTSRAALSKQTKSAAKKRGASSRHAAAKKAVRTKGRAGMRGAAKKAARTRVRGSSSGGSKKSSRRRASR
jgi:multidrug resistance efflux pump